MYIDMTFISFVVTDTWQSDVALLSKEVTVIIRSLFIGTR